MCDLDKAYPLVTVITVVLNGSDNLEKTIQSVVRQSYKNIQYIVIDGGSTDGSVDIIRKYEKNIDYWVSEKDTGIYDAMNKGIKLAGGRYVGIIGAGDWYDEGAISSVVNTFLRTDADVVYGDVEIVDLGTRISCRRRSRSDLLPKSMSSISHPSTFLKKSLYVSRFFNTQLKIAADYDLFLGLYCEDFLFKHCGSMIVHILTGGVSSTFKAQNEVYVVHKKYYGAFYAAREYWASLMRHCFYKSRRKILMCILSPALFVRLRAKWLQFKRN